MRGWRKKLIELCTLSQEEGEDDLIKCGALIRANFNVNPDELNEDDFAQLTAEAIWYEGWKIRNLARLFSGDKED